MKVDRNGAIAAYEFADLPDVMIWIERRQQHPQWQNHVNSGYYLVVGKRGQVITKRYMSELKTDELWIHETAIRILKSNENMKKILAFECPDCGGKAFGDRIKDGSHKGHGRIYCPTCRKTLVMI